MAPNTETRKVKFLTSFAGPDESWAPGITYDVDAEWAAKIVDGVRAVYVDEAASKPPKAPKADKPKREKKSKIEKATSTPAPETATGDGDSAISEPATVPAASEE